MTQFFKQFVEAILWVDWRAIFPVFTALAGAWMQAHLSQKGQLRTRLWDLKREAYGEILASLRDARKASRDIAREVARIGDKADTTPAFRTLLDSFVGHHRDLHRRIARDGIILSKAFREAVEAHTKTWEGIHLSGRPHPERAMALSDELNRFADEVDALARRELGAE